MNFKGCISLNKKKRQLVNGWTYAEAQKIWRTGNREAKLNKSSYEKDFAKWLSNLYEIDIDGSKLKNRHLIQIGKRENKKVAMMIKNDDFYDNWKQGHRLIIEKLLEELVPNEVYFYRVFNADTNEFGNTHDFNFKIIS